MRANSSVRVVPLGKLMLLFESTGFSVIDRQSLPDREEATLVAEKSPLEVVRGLERVQRVLLQDRAQRAARGAVG